MRSGNHNSRYREMPDDFREIAPTISVARAKRHWNTNAHCIARWHEEAGTRPAIMQATPFSVPVDPPPGFAEVATLSSIALQKRFGISETTVRRYRRQLGMVIKPGGRTAWDEERLAALARMWGDGTSLADIAATLNTTLDAVSWRVRRLKLPRRLPPAPAPRAITGTGSVKPGAMRNAARKNGAAPLPMRDDSRLGRAADDLRRAGYSPVCRVRTRDERDKSGDWFVGRRRMSAEDMIKLAYERLARTTPTTFINTGAMAL